ncbi:TetR family transcriptional regulator [Microtetraspora sp. AC03309]|uniref:TetR/AcrR family transcriptional regulator n=1 Tax=Microtetraspora sp. AC03309 TaxID=2779376 RepID=UPI00210381A0|nr:TetR family transcriptional regulator [Microtetraspora sp. AC03309]MCC5578162.1 TetR family transcriptional regulator [Microtetraspora sp. AC03309]
MSGRRPGSPQTREAILDAGLRAFTESGYAGTTIRAVARAAGVDPALVMHFFGSKDGLFEAAIRSGIPLRSLSDAADGDVEGLGRRVVARYIALWEDPETGARLHAVMSSVAASPAAADLFKEFVRSEVVRPFVQRLDVSSPETRAILAGSHLMGVAFARYVARIDPLVSLSPEELISCVAPAVQRYLTGDLPI